MADRETVLPDLGAPVADTHAHLDMLEDPVAALVNAARAGVTLIASVVDLTEEPEVTLDGLDGWLEEAGRLLEGDAPRVRLIAGVHPHNASRWDSSLEARLREIAAGDPRVAAIGEAGLDFHYDNSPRDAQRAMFRSHVRLARELGLPLVLHLREAHDEGFATLCEEGVPEAGCILHCFTEGPETARRFLDAGCHVSFAGPVTFPKAEQVREAAKTVPLDRVLVETDAPFLAPVPFRGRKNEPALCVLTAARVATEMGVDSAVLAASAMGNAVRLLEGGGGDA